MNTKAFGSVNRALRPESKRGARLKPRGLRKRGTGWSMFSVFIMLVSGLGLTGLAPSPASAFVPPETIVLDTGGADDWTNPNRADLSQMGSVDDGTTISVLYSVDDTDLLSGGQLVQACSLYDTTGEGKVDYALCHTFSNGVITGPTLYSCSNGFTDKCKQPMPVTTHDAACTTSTTAPDPFAGDANHQAAGSSVAPNPDTDFLVDCTISSSSVGGGTLLNVCTYPSGPPNSDAKDCVVTPGDGFLIIDKVSLDGDDTFDFTIDGSPTQIATTGGSGSTGIIPVSPAVHNVVELPAADWQLDSATCDNGDDPATVSVGSGLTVTCTFTNSVAGVPPAISLVKTADPTSVPEPGGDVTFTVDITNTGDAGTITSLMDDIHGDLATTCLDAGAVALVGQSIDAGQTLTCTFTANVDGAPGDTETDTVTAVVTNGFGQDNAFDTADVTIIDVAPTVSLTKSVVPASLPEPGGTFTYTLLIENTSGEDVTVTELTDTQALSLECLGLVNTVILVGGSVSCTYEVVQIDAGTYDNMASVTVVDDDGTTAGDSADATVSVTDVLPTVTLVKSVVPTSLDEPGGPFTYTLLITNTSVEDVTIDALTDTHTLSQACLDLVDTSLTPGQAVSCDYTVSYTTPGTYPNTATVDVSDNETNPASDTDTAVVTVADVPSSIKVTKTANPTTVAEPGGDVTFTFVVENTSTVDSVTINTLDDSIHGSLAGQGDCTVPQTIAAGGSYTCSITEAVAGNAGDVITNVLTVAGVDDDGNPVGGTDDAEVTVADVPSSIKVTKTADPTSVPESGGDVTYTVTVENTSAVDDVTIESVTDFPFGNVGASCSPGLPATLPPGESITCIFTKFISGDAPASHINHVFASGTDDDGNPVGDDDTEEVPFTEVFPDITVVKTATPTSLPETGGNVVFTFETTNNATEAGTLNSLIDSDFGNLNGQGDCVTPQPLAASGEAGDSYSCSVTVLISGDASGPDHINLVTATASDEDGNTTTDDDDAIVTFDDVLPDVSITKTPVPSSVPETGGDVVFTIVVTNNGLEDASIDSLVDSDFALATSCADAVGTELSTGASYSCTFTESLFGDFGGDDHVNTATVVASDDDGNSDTESADATVTYTDVLPDVSITKTANPTSVDEPGADVEFTIVVTNNSLEAATIDSLVDSDFDLSTNCGDAVDTVLASGANYTCTFTEFVAGNPADGDHMNTATVKASDNDGNTDTESDDETVTINDVAPDITVVKTASQDVVFAPGEPVTFTIAVTNNSGPTDPFTIDSLIDDVFGDITAECVLPQTIGSGSTFECDITRTIGSDHTNTVTATGVDDEGTAASGSDDAAVEMVNPSIAIDKTTNGSDGLNILEGSVVTWTYEVMNDGDVTMSNIAVTDDPIGAIDCPLAVLPAGESMTCTATPGTAIIGAYSNTGTVTGDYTDSDGDVADRSDTDDSSYFGASPSVALTKTFADDTVTVGGAASSFDLVVTNDGNIAIDDVSVTDLVDSRLIVSGVSSADADCILSAGQNVNCLTDLAVGQDVTITVNFSVAPSTLAADDVPNTADANDTYTDASGNSVDHGDTANDTVDIVTDINLLIDKVFNPTAVPQGTTQTFTIEVSNTGPSDAVDVSVTDPVDDSLAVSNVIVTSGDGDCSASAGQSVDCTVQLAAGESVLITVRYTAAPFFGATSPYGTVSGDDFRFVFVNGDVLEGSTDGGPVILNGMDITADVAVIPSLTKNDIIFDPPGDDPAFELHLSCSDPFTGGFGQSGGPTLGVDVNWQIAFFSIARYQNGDFRKSCGNVTNAYDVDNTASATGEDSSGIETVQDTATVAVEPGITVTRLQTNGKRLTVRLTNFTGDDKVIQDVSVAWPGSNGKLTKVRIDSTDIWTGSIEPGPALLDSTVDGWNGGTLLSGQGTLRFDFTKKSAKAGYTIRVEFIDGTFLDITA